MNRLLSRMKKNSQFVHQYHNETAIPSFDQNINFFELLGKIFKYLPIFHIAMHAAN